MSENYKKSAFKELLDKLQQESWQLELLISGFAIFGLFSSIEPLEISLYEAKALENYSKYFYPVALTSCYVLIVNLIVHVILRGLWIGAIGLRYVSDEIDYEELRYSKRFTDHLKKKVGSFDKYIATLENYCSILFAVTFLSLFYIISFFIVFFIILFAGYIFIGSGYFEQFTGTLLLGFFGIFFMSISFVVFFDFATQGLLKKKEWTSFLYMPIYKMFSVITLSFLYRPLVYNFLDNKFGRRLTLILMPLYLSAFYFTTLEDVRSNFLSKKDHSSAVFSKNNNYLNLLKKNEYVKDVVIDSKIITTPILKVFIPFKKSIENNIITQNKHLKPEKDKRGLRSSFFIFKKKNNLKKRLEKDSITSLYLKAFNKMYTIQLDTTALSSDFLISEVKNQIGFEGIFYLKGVDKGKHLLKIDRNITLKGKGELINDKVAEIPFWYYPE